jgi:NifU-like protein involved in Fe-S cluster formation
MQYPEAVLARFDAPAHAGEVPVAEGRLVTGRAGSEADGIDVAFEVRVHDGTIVAVGFRAWGCPWGIAACDLAAERLTGRPASALREFAVLDLGPELNLPPERRGRLLFIEDALRNSWQAWENAGLSPNNVSRSDP